MYCVHSVLLSPISPDAVISPLSCCVCQTWQPDGDFLCLQIREFNSHEQEPPDKDKMEYQRLPHISHPTTYRNTACGRTRRINLRKQLGTVSDTTSTGIRGFGTSAHCCLNVSDFENYYAVDSKKNHSSEITHKQRVNHAWRACTLSPVSFPACLYYSGKPLMYWFHPSRILTPITPLWLLRTPPGTLLLVFS